jgi:hypothetical protein
MDMRLYLLLSSENAIRAAREVSRAGMDSI